MSVDWPVRRLIDVVSLPVGQVSPLDEPYRGQILLAPDHISAGTGEILKRETAESQGAVSGKYVVRPGDVVFSKIRPALRKVVLADFEGICSADTYPLKPGADVVGEFVKAVLLGESFSRYVENLSGRTGIPKVNRADLAGFSFPVPPLPEQQRIVDVLQSVAKLERGIEASIAKLRSVRAGMVLSLVRATPDATAGEHGMRLGRLLLRIEGGRSPDLAEIPASAGGWGVLKVSAVHREGFRPWENKAIPATLANSRYEVHAGDLLFSRANTPELVGSACIAAAAPYRLMLSDKTLRLVVDPRVVDARYVNICLAAPGVRSQINSSSSGSSMSMQNISQRAVENLVIPRAGLSEQIKHVDQISSIDALIAENNAESAKLRKIKRGLIDDLLSGRVSVSNVEA
ncbi:restriction endonuclease subunit S [Streptantibioticus silvisoli]|uniref:Restriction endonuclease subunit S n=1 Tax=Streptantibioticus silvisoli TaxID=2705255 RepID=A0ABT6W555_9ACTN|nr:restriction endonuclease subunit S [Streptantibioticus silvisoli]MDI5965872.1 restriction endonuclease subunit S [Streptantibioticus silvisoli]